MEDDAIQTDVSTEETQVALPLSPREIAMQEIQQQIANQYDDPATVVEVVEVPEPAPVATPEEVKVRVKVDGEEKEITQADLVKGYQKDSVASKRLEEAAKKDRELAAREQALAERERQIAAAAIPSQEDEDDVDTDSIINALVEGDNEGAAKLLKDAIRKGRQPAIPAVQVDPAAIAAQVEDRVEAKAAEKETARVMQEFLAANPVFAPPAPDEDGNVILSKERVRGDYLYESIYLPKLQRGEIASYREALDATAAHVAREFTPPPPPAPTVNEREARKAKIDNLPVASGARVAAVVTERTPDDVLNDMRKARGQAI